VETGLNSFVTNRLLLLSVSNNNNNNNVTCKAQICTGSKCVVSVSNSNAYVGDECIDELVRQLVNTISIFIVIKIILMQHVLYTI